MCACVCVPVCIAFNAPGKTRMIYIDVILYKTMCVGAPLGGRHQHQHLLHTCSCVLRLWLPRLSRPRLTCALSSCASSPTPALPSGNHRWCRHTEIRIGVLPCRLERLWRQLFFVSCYPTARFSNSISLYTVWHLILAPSLRHPYEYMHI